LLDSKRETRTVIAIDKKLLKRTLTVSGKAKSSGNTKGKNPRGSGSSHGPKHNDESWLKDLVGTGIYNNSYNDRLCYYPHIVS
jgi:hypothetical protein